MQDIHIRDSWYRFQEEADGSGGAEVSGAEDLAEDSGEGAGGDSSTC